MDESPILASAEADTESNDALAGARITYALGRARP